MKNYQIIPLTPLLLFLMSCSAQTLSASHEKGYIDTHVHLREMKEGGPRGIMQNAKPQNRSSGMGRDMMSRGEGRIQPRSGKSATENLLTKMDSMGVSQALIVVVPSDHNSHMEEYISMKKLTDGHPNRLKLLAGGARLSDMLYKIKPSKVTAADKREFRKTAQSILDNGAVGFGEMISYHLCMATHHSFKYAAPDHPLFLLLSDIAAENDVAIDLHMEAIQYDRPMPQNLRNACSQNPATLTKTIPALEGLLAHNRKARIVWQHIGWDNTGDMAPSLLRSMLDKHANLYMGLRVEKRLGQVGNGGPMPNRIVDNTGHIKPEWRQLITDFPDRFVIGSDEFFYARTDERPNQSFVGTFSILDQLDNNLAQQVGRDNALRIYKLK